MAVADVYDALISRRPYKEPMPHAAALAYIVAESGRHFDPCVVQGLLANG
jgi:putative two-component system response regulator